MQTYLRNENQMELYQSLKSATFPESVEQTLDSGAVRQTATHKTQGKESWTVWYLTSYQTPL